MKEKREEEKVNKSILKERKRIVHGGRNLEVGY